MRTVYGDHERFVQTYFATYKGCISPAMAAAATRMVITGSPAGLTMCINVSGHRMGTAEIESALVAHPKVSEAAVVGYPHDIKGQGIYCYVTLMAGKRDGRACARNWCNVRKEIGPIASPDVIQFAPGLPKTRSGKIMRRILGRSPRTSSAILAILRPLPILQLWRS